MKHTTNAQQDTVSPEEALQALIMDPDLERLENLLAEFNLLKVLGVARSEIHHSRTIAWLLNPRESHGLGNYFLHGFLSQAAALAKEHKIKCVPFTPADVDGWKFSDINLMTEYHTDVGRIDVLLVNENDKFVCLIENKIGSDEGPCQLSRYLRAVESEYENMTVFPIFLTPDGRKPKKDEDTKRYVPLDYEMVANLIARVLEVCDSTINSSVANFLDQYKRTIRRRVLDTPSDIDKLALQIYNKHKQAIDLIIKAKPSNMLWDIVEPAVEKYAHDFKNHSRNKNHLYFTSPRLDFHIGENKPEPMFRFDFLHHLGELRLRLMVARDLETRNRLLKMKPPTDYDHRKHKPEHNEFRMYWKELLSKKECNPFDPEMQPNVENAIQEFYDNDYWPLVNAIRKEFSLQPASPS